MIGTEVVAPAKPDGCTILSLTASGVVVSVLREKLPYNLEREFHTDHQRRLIPDGAGCAGRVKSFADLVAAATFDGGHNLRVRGRHGERRSWNAASNLER
jgi:hypothetical protein